MGGESTHSHLTGRLLNISSGDRAVLLDDHRPAAITVSHTSIPAVVLAEKALGVTHE